MSFDLKQAKIIRREESADDSRVESYFEEQPEEDFVQEKPQHQKQPSENNGRIIHQWQAPEFEVYEKSARWYLFFAIFIGIIVVYALLSDGPIMAITFILLGIVGYIYMEKDPRIITFSITTKGVQADKEIYLYENINSFWIFYDPPHTKTLSIHTKANMLPYIHIPIRDEDPAILHEKLSEFIPEIKQDPSLVDTIERVLHI